MLLIQIPFVESLKQSFINSEGKPMVELNSFSFESSLREFTPTANFTLSYSGITPDLLNLWIGSEFAINWQKMPVEEDVDENTEETPEPEKHKIARLCVEALEEASNQTQALLKTRCTGEFNFYQNDGIREGWVDSSVKPIIEDCLKANSIMREYPQDIQDSDNATTIYRTLGESDFSFLTDSVAPNFTIQWGRPIAFTDLDGVFHFTSVNALINAKTKSHYVFTKSWPDKGLKYIRDYLLEKVKSYAKDDYVIVNPEKANLLLGKDRNYKSLKNSVYYTKNEIGSGTTTRASFQPCGEDSLTYPVLNNFLKFVDSFETYTVQNRPTDNILFESKNNTNTEENLITHKLEFSKIDQLDTIIQAGDTVTYITDNPFSVYNGNYIVESVKYSLTPEGAYTLEMYIIKPNLDFSWQDNLENLKDQEGFNEAFPYFPPVQKDLLFTCD